MSFEMTTEAGRRVAARGGGLLMRRRDQVLARAGTVFESPVVATQIETFPLVIRLVTRLVAPKH